MNLMQKCLLFPMVGLKSEIFAFIAENFTIEICCRTCGPPCTYNSGSTGRREKIYAQADSACAISYAVVKMATLGDLYDLQRSRGQFSYH